MANLKVLMRINDEEYIWDYRIAKNVLDVYVKRHKITKIRVYQDLSERCFVTIGAVKNWFTGKNGPGDIDQIKLLAEYLEEDYQTFGLNRSQLVREWKAE